MGPSYRKQTNDKDITLPYFKVSIFGINKLAIVDSHQFSVDSEVMSCHHFEKSTVVMKVLIILLLIIVVSSMTFAGSVSIYNSIL